MTILSYCTINAQCCIDTNLVILDESSQSLKLNVSGININDLSNPMQGVCKVKLKFTHQYIGDLTVILTSPSGQKVELIGPVCPSSITQNSLFDISFVRCLTAPSPDPGFKFRWDNCQKWGAFSRRTGSYWPHKLCLEDFNSGPVNGTWTLVIKDEDRFYSGKLLSFCMEFCNNEFENCENCEANGGVFSGDTTLEMCRNDPELNIRSLPLIPSALNNNSLYAYKYYIVENDKIIDLLNTPNLSGRPPGVYTICGVSYLLDDEPDLPTAASVDKFSKIRSDFESGRLGLCAALSVNCLTVSIFDFSPITMLNVKICSKDTFVIGASKFTSNGAYVVQLRNRFGCDSTVNLNLTVEDLEIKINPVLALDCMNNNVVIDASSSSVPTDALIEWITTDGQIIDSSNKLRIIVNKGGKYKLRVRNKKCIDSSEVEVLSLENIPELSVITDTLSCKKPVIDLLASTNTSNVAWQWRDNNNILIGVSSLQKITRANLYTVIVTDQNGCSNSLSIRVVENKSVPRINISSTEISCKIDSAQLISIPQSSIELYDWKKNNVTISNDSSLFVKDTGSYVLTVTGLNGCTASKTIQVNSRVAKPEYRAIFNEISCKDTSITIISLVQEPYSILEFYKNEPDSFYFTGKNPVINKAGKYFIRFIDTAACKLDTFIEVIENFDLPNFKLSSNNLTCDDDSVQIKLDLLSDTTMTYEYIWSGPIGFASTDRQPWIKERGTYYVQIIGSNGCIAMDSVVIEEDVTRPKIELFADTITCKSLFANVTSKVNNPFKYQWSGPDNFISTMSDITVNTVGFYTLVVTSMNGCSSERTIEVIKDTTLPFASLRKDTINCRKINLALKADFISIIDSVNWYFNSTLFSKEISPVINQPGIYTLYARGLNGCDKRDSIFIIIDTIRVPVEILSDTLSCSKDSVELSPDPIILNASYRWITSSNDTLNQALIYTKTKGLHRLQVTESNGCVTELTQEVIEIKSPPSIQFLVDTITCKRKIASIRPSASNTNINYNWLKPDQTNTDSSIITTSQPGTFLVTITDEFGCMAYDTIEVIAKNKLLQLILTDSIFNCVNKDSNFLTFKTTDSLVNFFWTDPSGNVLRTNLVTQVASGRWSVFAENIDGCEFNTSINVQYDTISPQILDISIDTFTCKNRVLRSRVRLNDSRVRVMWTDTGSFTSASLEPIFPGPGEYHLQIIDSSGCKADTLIKIVTDTIKPDLKLQSDSINCINNIGTISIITSNVLSEIFFVNSKGDTLRSNPLKTSKADRYKGFVINKANGCFIEDSIQLINIKSSPVVMLSNFSFGCKDDSLQLSAAVDCPNAVYTWSNSSNTFNSNAVDPFIKDTGQYYLKILCPASGCDTSLSFKVDRQNTSLSLSIQSDTLNCYKDSIQLFAITTFADSVFEWRGPNNYYSQVRNPVLKEPGQYRLKVSNIQGCSKDTIIEIIQDRSIPQISLIQLDTLRCDSNRARIMLMDSNSIRLKTINWTSPDGNIISDSKSFIVIDKSGLYNVEVIDQRSGCKLIKSIQIVEKNNQILLDKVISRPISCFNKKDGEIEIISVSGGTEVYKYRINKGIFDTGRVFNNLGSGQYLIEVIDYYGCKIDTLIELQNAVELKLEIIRDTILNLGDKFELGFVANFSNIKNINWSPSNTLSCNDCFHPTASPIQTQEYELVLIDSNGCEVRDRVLITVITDVYVFVPSVFSPNGDGINDFLEVIATPGISVIESYRVFDRWGALVYELKNFDPSNKTLGWNGEFKGQLLNPGVYVYDIIAVSKSGSKLRISGDATLLR